MMTFRKLAAASAGKLIRAYFTENTPAQDQDAALVGIGHNGGPQLDPGGRLTTYYTRRNSRASWRPDMPRSVAATRMAPSEHWPMAKQMRSPDPPRRRAVGVIPSRAGAAA